MEKACRICRGDETEGELSHPCKCTGTIKYVHQECLVQWLGRKSKFAGAACELCGHKYQFESIYSQSMNAEGWNLHAYLWVLWQMSKSWRQYLNLIIRALVMAAITAVVMRISYGFFTHSGDSVSYGVLLKGTQVMIRRQSHGGYWFSPHLKNFGPFETRAIETLITGFGLLLISLTLMLSLWMISAWTLQDRVLLVELQHIVQHGEEWAGAQQLQDELDTIARNGLIDANAEDREAVRQALRRGFQGNDAQAREFMDQMLAAQLAMAGIDDEPDAGDNFWIVFDDLFGGSLVEIAQMFTGFITLAVLLIGIFYHVPYILGNTTTISLMLVYKRLRGYSVESVSLPTSLEFRVFTFLLGVQTILGCTCLPYFLMFRWMRRTLNGRQILGIAKQVASIEKVFAVVFIEAVMFPIFCGLLLHISMTPVIEGVTISSFVEQLRTNPRLHLAIWWSTGMFYMYTLSDFFRRCRKFLRPGVLYFIQDPSDPRNEPIRHFLANSLVSHMRKITFSALIYTGLLGGCIGGFTLLLRVTGVVPHLISPLRLASWPGWSSTRLWVFAGVFIHMICFQRIISKMGDLSAAIFATEFERAAKWLDLESFLFGRMTKVSANEGTWVRAPTEDSPSARRNARLFAPVDGQDRLIKPLDPLTKLVDLTNYVVVWRPQNFWLRVVGLLAWILLTSYLICGLIVVVPLFIGREYESMVLTAPKPLNDWSLYIMGFVWCCATVVNAEQVASLNPGLLWKLPLLTVAHGYSIYFEAQLAESFFSGWGIQIQPSQYKSVAYLIYGWCSFAVLGLPDLRRKIALWKLFLLASLCIPSGAYGPWSTLMWAYGLWQYVPFMDEAWRESAVKSYYKIGDRLLNRES